MINSNAQSYLARLLAKENIEIRHGEYHTAFFDVEQRVLGLPLWKDRGKDVYDLLVGHEVGHALYTPKEGWHESVVELAVPRSFVNVIEDIRIEKKIQRTYPGLVASFQRGYAQLVDENFFGTAENIIEDYKLVDRINLKAKCGSLVDVQFSDEEMPIVQKAMGVETWEDVLEVCQMLMEYVEQEVEEQQDEEMEVKVPVSTGDDDSEDSGDDQSSADQDSDEDGDDSSDTESGPDNSDEQDESEQQEQSSVGDEVDSEEDEDQNLGSEAGAPSSEEDDKYRVRTDETFRERESDLLENLDGKPRYKCDLNKQQLNDMIIPYAKIKECRDKIDSYEEKYPSAWAASKGSFNTFLQSIKGTINVMAREFEMRKAAYQYSRGSTAKTGKIDPIKLHSYKYNEDIFNRVINLADAKSHGLVMYIDFSGSMYNNIASVVEQVICLTQFCKKVNIPFAVYGFSSNNYRMPEDHNFGYGTLDTGHVRITEQLSSSMKKSEYLDAMFQMYYRARNHSFYHYESMGATPLVETIMAAHKMIPEFQRKNNIQKVTAVFLTDGDASSLDFGWNKRETEASKHSIRRDGFGIAVQVGNKLIPSRGRVGLTNGMLQSLKEQTGCTLIGFHIPDSPRAAAIYLQMRGIEYSDANKYRRELNRTKSAIVKNVGGFDELYLIKGGKALEASDDGFEVKEEAKKGEIARAFKKFTGSKKSNRIIMTTFAQKVA